MKEHILDRKLFENGGYYLSNSAPVCAKHHWDCEITKISVEIIRKALNITEFVLPHGFIVNNCYDKWGNTIINDFQRVFGPLKNDDGMIKALKLGGVFWQYSD